MFDMMGIERTGNCRLASERFDLSVVRLAMREQLRCTRGQRL
jgi:hypothetical protein